MVAPLRRLIQGFDAWLSRIEGVNPFTSDPLVILRVQQGCASWDIDLPQGIVERGSATLFVHLWNERIPPIPAAGADLAWARSAKAAMMYSFQALAAHVRGAPALLTSKAVGGHTVQTGGDTSAGRQMLLEALGFTIFPYHGALGRFGEFWENFYTWWLMWTFNPSSLRHHGLLGFRRYEFWMGTAEFLRRFGPTQVLPSTHAVVLPGNPRQRWGHPR